LNDAGNAFGDTVTVGHSGITAGAVSMTANGGITVAQTDNGANTKLAALSLTSTGGINQSGALVVTGGTTLNAGSLIDLTNAGNDFSTLTVSHGGNNVNVVDANAIVLDAGTMDNDLTLTTGGAITQSGAVTVGGITTLDAGSNAITLSDISNSFSTLGLTASAATIVNTGALALGTINTGDLNLTAGGDITKANGSVNIAATGTTTLNAAGHDISLNGTNNNFNTVAITAGNNVSLTDTNALNLGASTVSGTLDASTGGAITQSGALSVTGNTTLNAGGDITLNGANHLNGTVSLTGNNIDISNIDALALGNVTATGNFGVSVFGNLSQVAGTSIHVAGTTSINAESNDVTLANDNLFSGDVSITGNNLSLTQASGNDLTLNNLNAYGNVVVNDNGGTLTFTGNAPTIALRNGVGNSTVTLISNQFSNQNADPQSSIDLGTGTGNAWHFYLDNLNGNTFGSGSNVLNSNNQAIWGTTYPTAISQTGNRYIFGTSETLTLTPITNSLNLTANSGAGMALPTPQQGTNYQVSGFVNASNYGNAFTQDTVANTVAGNISFASAGSSASAPVGTYDITMTAPASSPTGYNVTSNNPFGTITVVTPNKVSDSNPAILQNNVESFLPTLGNRGQLPHPLGQQAIESIDNGINPDFNDTRCKNNDPCKPGCSANSACL
jgi:hypothetical protein